MTSGLNIKAWLLILTWILYNGPEFVLHNFVGYKFEVFVLSISQMTSFLKNLSLSVTLNREADKDILTITTDR